MIKEGTKLHNYLLHFNQYTGMWAAVPRGKVNDYFNNLEQAKRVNSGIFFSGEFTTLIELLNGNNKTGSVGLVQG